MKFKAILFDFDGVLSKDRFYRNTLLPKYTDLYNWIQVNIFTDKELLRRWMKGEINSYKINALISRNTNIDYETLKKLFEDSVRNMRLDKDVLAIAKSLKLSHAKLGIVTDNMDSFTAITVPTYKLDTLFDVIINSADHGILKSEESGKLFDIALTKLGVSIDNTLLIDDSEKNIQLYTQKGGQGFLYRNTEELRLFLENKE